MAQGGRDFDPEAGVPGYEASTASGVLAPANTPGAIVSRLNAEIVKVVRSPEVSEALRARGVEPVGSTAQQDAEHLRREFARYAAVVRAAGIRPE